MGIENASGCSKIKRKKMAINWKQLLPSSSGDDDRPTEVPVTSKKKFKGSGSGGEAEYIHIVDLNLETKSYNEITEYIARTKKLLILCDGLPDRGDKLKETLQRHEDELERRNQVVDLKLQAKSYDEIVDYVARSKRVKRIYDRLPDKGKRLKETIQRYEDELKRRNKLRSEKVLPVAKGESIRNLCVGPINHLLASSGADLNNQMGCSP